MRKEVSCRCYLLKKPIENLTSIGYFVRKIFCFFIDGTWAQNDCYDAEHAKLHNISFEKSTAFLSGILENETSSPVEQYWK